MNKWAQGWNPTTTNSNSTAPRRVGRRVRKLEPTANRRVLDRYGALDKARSAMLMQIRTGHASLNGFLATIGAVSQHESQCPCGYGIETRDHVLLHCGLHQELRKTVLWANNRKTDINVLLGDPQRVASTTNFIMQADRQAATILALPTRQRSFTGRQQLGRQAHRMQLKENAVGVQFGIDTHSRPLGQHEHARGTAPSTRQGRELFPSLSNAAAIMSHLRSS